MTVSIPFFSMIRYFFVVGFDPLLFVVSSIPFSSRVRFPFVGSQSPHVGLGKDNGSGQD